MKVLIQPTIICLLLCLAFSSVHAQGSVEVASTGKLQITNSSTPVVLDMRSNNPLVEFRDASGANYLAFMQVFGSDFYLANRQNGQMIFRTNNLNRMSISGDGNVGIGTLSPTSKLTILGPENNGTEAGLEVRSGGQTIIMDGNEIDCTSGGLHLNYNSLNDLLVRTNIRRAEVTLDHANGSGTSNGVAIQHPGSNNVYWTWYATNSDGFLELYYKGSLRGEFNSASGEYNQVSDRRLKARIAPLYPVLDKVLALEPTSYSMRDDTDSQRRIGMIAQDVEKLFPEIVSRGHIGDTQDEVYTMNYSTLGVLAIAGLQELAAEDRAAAEELRHQNSALRSELASLEARVARLEAFISANCQTD